MHRGHGGHDQAPGDVPGGEFAERAPARARDPKPAQSVKGSDARTATPRRAVRVVALAAAVSAVAWIGLARPWQSEADAAVLVRVQDPAVATAEQARRAPGATIRDVSLTAAPAPVRLGERPVSTWCSTGPCRVRRSGCAPATCSARGS